MALISFGYRVNMYAPSLLPTDPAGYIVAYDLDGVLKQKNYQGVVTLVGSGSGGPQGPPGPVGPAGLTWSGYWVATQSYSENYAVGYASASWWCISGVTGATGNDSPDIDTTHWTLLAAQGSPGSQGAQGEHGLDGPQGLTGATGATGAGVTSSFYLQGTTDYSYDTTSAIYRTGPLSIGTGTTSDSRFVVSSSGGTVSLVVDEFGNVYNNGKGNEPTNTIFGLSSFSNNLSGAENTVFGAQSLQSSTTTISQNGLILISSGTGYTQSSTFSNIQLSYLSGPTAVTYPKVTVFVGSGGTISNIYCDPRNNPTDDLGTGFEGNTIMTGDISGITFSVQATTFATGTENVVIGFNSLSSNLNGSYNTAIGNYTLGSDKYGTYNTAVGYAALYYNTSRLNTQVFGVRSTAIGSYTMFNNTVGNGVAVGMSALFSNTTGTWNIAIGFQAGNAITIGSGNTIIADTGFASFGGGISTGSNNLIIAQNSGNTTGITTGSNNTIVGKVTGLAAGLTNSVILSDGVGNIRLYVNSSGNFGLGTTSPSTKLHVYATQSGAFRLEDGTQGNGYVLISDANGVATWTSSIQTQLDTKLTAATGTINYLQKVNGVNSLGNSQIIDDGTNIRIKNTELFPNSSYDVSLGFDADKTVAIEDSNNTIVGRDLTINAGRAINFSKSSSFVSYYTALPTSDTYAFLYVNRNNTDIYLTGFTSGIYKQTAGIGTFNYVGNPESYKSDIFVNSLNGDVWTIGQGIYKQTGGSGSFASQSTTGLPTLTVSQYNGGCGICVNPTTNDVWVAVRSGGLYKQTGGVGSFVLVSGSPTFGDGAKVKINPLTNDVFACNSGWNTGSPAIYKQTAGIGSFSLIYNGNNTGLDIEYSTGTLYVACIGDIKKQTNGVGSFISQSNVGAFAFNSIGIDSVGNVFSVAINISSYTAFAIYKQTNYAIGSPNLQGGTLKLNAGTGKGTGDSNLDFYTGQKLTSGTDMQTSTLRLRINNEGNIGIGTATPSTTLHIYGTQSGAFRLVDTTQGTGKVLISDANGVATWTSSIQTQLDTKLTAATGTINYLQKVNGVNSLGNSSIFDDGSGYIGINNVNTPTKDITLGNQINREIGIEQSNSVAIGRNLIVSAGRTINYNDNSDYNLFITSPSNRYWGMANMIDGGILVNDFGGGGTSKIDLNATTLSSVATGGITYPITSCQNSNGDIYQIEQGTGDIYKKTFAGTAFVNTGISAMTNFGVLISFNGAMTAGADGQIYVFCSTGVWVSSNDGISYTQLQTTVFTGGCKKANGDILALSGSSVWKRTGGSGLFIDTAVATTGRYITETPNGNVFVSVYGGSIWMQTNGSGPFTNLNQTIRSYNGIASDSNGNVFVCVDHGGLIYKQNNSTVGTADLRGGTLKLYSGTGKGTGASDIEMYTGQATASGTDMQISTLRLRIDNEGNVGIGTATPSTTLHIYATQSGAFRLEDGTQGTGKVLISDANGVGSWTASLAGLSLLGNSEVISTAVIATASVVVYDYSLSSLWYHGTASSNFTANFTNLPTTDNRVLSASIVINQGLNGYIPNVVQIEGVTQSVKWPGGTQSGTSYNLDIVTFNFIRTSSTWTNVIGQVASFT